MMRILYMLSSAALGVGLLVLLGDVSTGVQSASIFGAPAPIAAMALAFPAIYLLWEHQD